MPWTTVVNGTTQITAAFWHPNVRDQVVSQFSSASARNSAITAPVAGMVTAITDNTAAEGLYARTSASTWRAPWNLPWGLVAATENTGAAAVGLGAAEADTNISVTFDAVANRRYRASGVLRFVGTSGDVVSMNITDALNVSVSGFVSRSSILTGEVIVPFTTTVFGLAAGSRTIKVRAFRAVGGNLFDVNGGGVTRMCLLVEDVGPSGAPT